MRSITPESISRLITEDPGGSASSWYKGISVYGGLQHHPTKVGATNKIPLGFLGDLHLAFIYADPTLAGSPDDPSIIIEAIIDDADVEDRTEEFLELGYNDISSRYPGSWQDEGPWTAGSGSAHGESDFVFVGIPWPYRVIASFRNHDEWLRAYEAHKEGI